ncbi:MAG: T9SS type A sorting domain-containing protein, partial [Sphingobacteriales bacterium]
MQYKIATLLASLFLGANAYAQDFSNVPITDGFDAMMQRAEKENPNFRRDLNALNTDISKKTAVMLQIANKTTAIKEVPVIFHVVLSSSQMNQIGGTAGVEERIQSQLNALNDDFNATNADKATIPAEFKSLYGNVGIHFALAHKDPQGNYTPGYEIVSTTKNGFDVQSGTMGSKFACSDAKFKSSGGADAWDTKRYVNIWVINITPAGVGGVGTPPPYAVYGGTSHFPWNEQGIAIAYFAFGKKTQSGQYFPAQSAKNGRTLVHEMGHYFNLFHPFGMSTMNNTNCTDDDGVSDTPLESGPVQSTCPNFPLLDKCTNTFPGVMFMNHMDYTADTCRTMFTLEQAARVNVELQTNGYRETLFNNDDLINFWPQSVADMNGATKVSLYPNPANNSCIIDYKETPSKIVVLNSLGQIVKSLQKIGSKNTTIDLSEVVAGNYIVK